MTAPASDSTANAIIDSLNAEKRAWSFEVTTHLVLEREVVVLGRLSVDGVVKMAFGSAEISREADRAGSVGLVLKLAANEALARAAKLTGVGLVFDRPETSDGGSKRSHTTAEPPSPENRVTQKQLGAIHGFARRRNMGRSELGALLHERFDKTELVSLTKKEASALLDELAQANGHAAGP